MDLPTVGAAGTDFTPSRSARYGKIMILLTTPISFQSSTAGVAASIPFPEIGQTLSVSIGTGADGPGGTAVAASSSAFTIPLTMLGVQGVALPQFGGLSLRMPKFEPPMISR